MTAQPALDLPDLVEPDYEPELTLDERYALWIAANPHVLDALERLADQWPARHGRIGVKALTETLRYRSGVETTGSAWKVDNSFTSRLARDLVARRPDLDGRIERRRLRTDP